MNTRPALGTAATNSDAALIAQAILNAADRFAPGNMRRATILLAVPIADRTRVSLRGNEIVNTSPGWRPSDALWQAARENRDRTGGTYKIPSY